MLHCVHLSGIEFSPIEIGLYYYNNSHRCIWVAFVNCQSIHAKAWYDEENGNWRIHIAIIILTHKNAKLLDSFYLLGAAGGKL